MPNPYTINTLVQLTATFTTVATGVGIAPTTVVFTVRKPDTTTTTPTVTNPGLGVYQTNVLIDQSGLWEWRAAGSGAAQVVQDGEFVVIPNTF